MDEQPQPRVEPHQPHAAQPPQSAQPPKPAEAAQSVDAPQAPPAEQTPQAPQAPYYQHYPQYSYGPQYYPQTPPQAHAYGQPPVYHQPYGYQPPYGWSAPPPAATPAPRRRRRVLIGSGIAAVIAAACIAALVGTSSPFTVSGTGSQSSTLIPGSTGNGSSDGSSSSDGSGSGPSQLPGGTGGTGSTDGSGSQTSSGTATQAQQVGVVDINTVLKYQGAQAAGTGVVLTSNGEILTNNHVVEGATSITVTVVTTGKTYTARVVGTDPTADVAVLQLSGASGLKTANISTSAKVSVGDTVTAVGNAGGVGGTPSSATGTVSALDQSITASDESGANAEHLTGLIESNAPIQAGDSGGPLYNAKGQVVGIDTAGSSSGGRFDAATTTQAYAIPIATAVDVAKQIEAGHESSTIHLGYPPFLGVQIASAQQGGTGGTADGALVAGVVAGTPAQSAGIVAGDTITAIGSKTIASASDLSSALASYEPGQSVKVSWTDAAGQSHTSTIKLVEGPAD